MRRRAEGLDLSRRFAVGATALAMVGPLAGGASFAFHAVASRALGPDGYGGLSALLALSVAVAVPAAAVQVTLARSLLSGIVSAGHLRRWAERAAAVVAVLTVVVAPAVSSILRLGTSLPVVALVGYLAATIVGVVPKAVLVAQERLGALAAGTLLGVAARLGVGAFLLIPDGDLVSAVAAGSVGEIVATGSLLWVTRSTYAGDAGSAGGWRTHVGPVLGFGCLWALFAVDTAASRVVMDGNAAGAYGASTVLARAILFLPHSIATAAFVRLANPVTRARALSWATALALTLSVLGVCGLAVLGEPAAATLFGSAYPVDVRVLVVLGAGAAAMSVVNVWVHSRVAYGQPVGLRMVGALGVASLGVAPAAAGGASTLAWWMAATALVALWLVRPRSAVAVPFPNPNAIPPGGAADVTIVLPAFNVATTVGRHLESVETVLTSIGRSFEVVVVDDGSTDGTAREAEAAAGPWTRVVRVAHRGKGAALLAGMSEAGGNLVGFIDADGDIDAGVLRRLLEAAARDGVDGAIAVKEDLGSRGLMRRVASIGYRLVVRGTLAVDVSDTQTGAKVFRRETVAAVLPWLAESGYAWDAEFLATARHLGFRSFVEVPVPVSRSSSAIGPRAAWSMLRATLRVGSRVAMLPSYRPASPDEGARSIDPVLAHPGVPDRPLVAPERPLRILILNWKCRRHPAAGGAEVFTHEVARRWVAMGHDVTLFVPRVEGAPARETVDGYQLHRHGGRLSVYREARRFWHDNRGDFDVIIDEVNTRPFEASLWADVPVVACFFQLARDVWFHELPVLVAAAGRYVLEPSWLRACRDVPVVTISESSAASLRAAGLGRVVNIGVGASLPDQDSVPCPKANVPTVAFVGRMVSAKRPLDALTAFEFARRELGGGRLLLMGDGPIAPIVRDRARNVEGAEFLGRVSEAEKFQNLASAHALVVTSVREGWGLVVDEAAAVGAYPIGYRVPGLMDSVPAAGGVLVDPTPQALAAALVEHLPRLQHRPADARQGGARTWDEVSERFLAVVATTARPLERT